MVKKIVFLLATVFALASCNNTAKQTLETKIENAPAKTETVDTHNSRNSLDVAGMYKGQLPGANSEMDVTIVLTDSTYTKDIIYKDKGAKPFSSNGTYTWSADGSKITLNGEEKPNEYVVGENTLTQLDIEGKPITGDLAPMFVLRK